jgi:carbamoyltransferase|tara:strand:- start:19 stop:1602 length:1584 start_codon:yes stop_codon:yes gene_type:complete
MGHDGSVTILEGDQIVVHHQLERFNGLKNHFYPTINIFDKIKNLNIKFDKVIITSMSAGKYIPMVYYLKKYLNIDSSKVIGVFQNEHHLFHAKCARHFFNYPKNAVYFISDGDGGHKVLQNNDNQFLNGVTGTECESVYDENIEPLYKYYVTDRQIKLITDKFSITRNLSLGKAYQKLVYELGLDSHEEGKAMALSSYGKFSNDIANKLVFDNNWNLNWMSNIEESYEPTNHFNRYMLNPSVNHTARDSKSLDFAKTFQIVFQLLFLQKVQKINKKYELLVLSGGCAQNVLNNSFLKNELNKDILADPFNGDFGISLGAALHYTNVKVKPLKHICSGFDPIISLHNFESENVTPEEVAEILVNEPIAIFSGKSEQGQRGLGFRSLLGNPLDDKILNKINSIKKREWYRPFACTVLKEEASGLFEIKENITSPYMMFVYKCKDKRLKNVCSVDNYSRIQTLERQFNPKYYDLINAFKKLTGLPAVLNTSLNLPGRVLCEDTNDLYFMMKNSSLKYCYLCDENKLLWLT